MLRKVAVLIVTLLSVMGMWFAFDTTRLAGSTETLEAMRAQLTSLRFGYAVGIGFGVVAGVMLTLTFKSART